MDIDGLVRTDLNRRGFLKLSAATAALLPLGCLASKKPALESLEGVVHPERVVFPPLKGSKVQPPKHGCYIGYHYEHTIGPQPYIDFYNKWVEVTGKKPAIIITSIGWTVTDLKKKFPSTLREQMTKSYKDSEKVISFFYRDLQADIKEHGGFGNLAGNKQFGKDVERYAQQIEKYKEPMFFCTMRELNGHWFPWGEQSKTVKEVWKFMWQIFEDNGANEYATWVWEVYCPFGRIARPEGYYPGDDYVDWIGLSTWSRANNPETHRSYRALTERTYEEMLEKGKPIIQAEAGRTRGRIQKKWVKGYFETVREWAGIKAAIIWSGFDPSINDNHYLTDKTLRALSEVVKEDRYFIGA